VRWIRSDSTVLDVGTATGALGDYLSRHGCIVDGVEKDVNAAAGAREHYRQLVVADLDLLDLPETVRENHYDYIVFADILEHLADPCRVLQLSLRLLAPGGHILISVPNIAYSPLIAELLSNRFEYRQSGILDRTHRWFFTRSSLERLVKTAGLHIVARAEILKPPHESEFDTQFLEAIPPGVRGYLSSMTDGTTYQFLLNVVPSESAVDEENSVDGETTLDRSTGSLPSETRFLATLDWRFVGSSYTPSSAASTTGVVGGGYQHLRFLVPAMEVAPVAVRLQPADRKTVIHLIRVVARTNDASLVWSWDCTFESLEHTPKEGIVVGQPASGTLGVPLELSGFEARFELPLETEHLAALSAGGEVEIQMNWPESPEYMGILSKTEGSFTELRSAEATIRDLIRSRDDLLELQERRLDVLKKTEREVHALTEERDRLSRLLDDRLELLKGAEEQVHTLTEERTRLSRLLDDRLELLNSAEEQVRSLTKKSKSLRDILGRFKTRGSPE
jgi:2-polyprenyl-3-methyl-5-hydroxy-6-metoxy-1,4-benzoquinol methylase